MNNQDQLLVLRQDLNFITVKEIQDIIKGTNVLLKSRHRISGGGRKNEIIDRYTSFLLSLLQNKREGVLNEIMIIVNRYSQSKFFWSYNSEEIVSSTSRYARPALWQQQTASSLSQVRFRMEPFFKPVATIVEPKMIPASNSRNSSYFQFQLTPEHIRLLDMPLEQDQKPKYQVRLCCATYSSHTQALQQGLPLEFPNTCELKINDSIIANSTIRCIKGKPGTIHPADLSIGIRKSSQNIVELLYIQSSLPFVAAVYLVEKKTTQSFIEDMKNSRQLTKEKVLEKMKSISEDADIVMESETLSMKCPLAFTRIQTPCRSIHCNHLQCFDANTFLVMNEQTPTWSCPVCYKRIPEATDLALDEYFLDILDKVPTSVESVKVEPDGHIVMEEQPEETLIDSSDDDDETDNGNRVVKEEVAEGSMSYLLRKESQNQGVIIILDDDDDDDDDDNNNTINNNTINNNTINNNTINNNTINNNTTNNNNNEVETVEEDEYDDEEEEEEEDSEEYSRTDSYNTGHSDSNTDDSNKSDITDNQTPPEHQGTSDPQSKSNQTSQSDQDGPQSVQKEKESQIQIQIQTNQQQQQQSPQPVVQDPLQLQLQQQIQQQLQQNQQESNNYYMNSTHNNGSNQYAPYMPPPLHHPNGYTYNPQQQQQQQQQQNGYPNHYHNTFSNTFSNTLPPLSFDKPSSSSVAPQKRKRTNPFHPLPPVNKQKVNDNVIDLTLSSDDEY